MPPRFILPICLGRLLFSLRVIATGDANVQLDIRLSNPIYTRDAFLEETTRLNVFNLIPEEYRTELLSLTQSLDSLGDSKLPYCSDRLSALLRKCTKDRLATEDRNEAAMFFTLCDRGQDYAPPMECESLVVGSIDVDKSVVRRCAMALDQHQNFQRTFDVYRVLVIPEKCKTLNSIFNVDPLRDTYRNVTLQLLGFLRTVATREEKTEEYFSQWDQRLNAFRVATSDLINIKRSLVDFNEHFVEELDSHLQVVKTTFDGLSAEALKVNNEVSSGLKEEMISFRREHVSLLALAATSVETLVSEGLRNIFEIAQENQKSLNSAAISVINQLTGAGNDLLTARQDFQALGIFVKEMTSKAYNQAFLLDKKQYEVSESLSGLSAEIRGLENSTHQLNYSLANLREEADDNFVFRSRQSDASWLRAAVSLRDTLSWLGLPPFWAASFLIMSLPRIVTEQATRLVLWAFATILSVLTRTVLGHRKNSYACDAEQNIQNQPSAWHPHSQSQNNAIPQATYTTGGRPFLQTSESINEVDKLLADWASLRTCARAVGSSRIPERLYGNSGRPTDAFSRIRQARS